MRIWISIVTLFIFFIALPSVANDTTNENQRAIFLPTSTKITGKAGVRSISMAVPQHFCSEQNKQQGKLFMLLRFCNKELNRQALMNESKVTPPDFYLITSLFAAEKMPQENDHSQESLNIKNHTWFMTVMAKEFVKVVTANASKKDYTAETKKKFGGIKSFDDNYVGAKLLYYKVVEQDAHGLYVVKLIEQEFTGGRKLLEYAIDALTLVKGYVTLVTANFPATTQQDPNLFLPHIKEVTKQLVVLNP